MATNKALLGLLAGAAVGAAIGILFAPEKGSETRKKFLRKGEGYSRDFKNRFREWTDKGAEKLDEAREGVREVADKGKSKTDELKRDLKTT